jgi:hypothetical protein
VVPLEVSPMEVEDHSSEVTLGERSTGETLRLFPVGPPPRALHASDAESMASAGKIAVFDAAIARRSASFTQLATATFFSQEPFSADPLERAVYERYIGPLTEAFEAAHGPIIHSFYCKNVIAAAALTGTQELCLVPPPLSPEILPIAELLFECDRLSTEADRVLAPAERSQDLQATKRLTYGVVSKLLSLLDDPTGPPPRSVIDLHRREARHASDYYRRAADRYAKFDYFRGMMMMTGAVASVLVAAGAWAVTRFTPDFDAGGYTFLGCLIAGGIGAVVSVMSRMTLRTLSLDYEAGGSVLAMLGAFRPVIGMVMGGAMWVMTASGVLAILPSDPSKLTFFRILTAFLAGFSERWAQDMLGSTTRQIAGRSASSSGSTDNPEHMPSAKVTGGTS